MPRTKSQGGAALEPDDLASGVFFINGCRLQARTISIVPARRNGKLHTKLRNFARDNEKIFEQHRCARTILSDWFCRLEDYQAVQSEFERVIPAVEALNQEAEAAGIATRLGTVLAVFPFDRANPTHVDVLKRSLQQAYEGLFVVLRDRIVATRERGATNPLRAMPKRAKALDVLIASEDLRERIHEATVDASRAIAALNRLKRDKTPLDPSAIQLWRIAGLVRYFGGDPDALPGPLVG
jgi:hypothetical protein